MSNTRPKKSGGIAFVLWLLLGLIGGHRYYLGRIPTALLQTLTIGGFGVWWIIDLFLLRGLVRSANRTPSISSKTESIPTTIEATDEGEKIAPGVVLKPNGAVSLDIDSVAEARVAITQLKLRKKQFGIEKRAIANAKSSVQSERRLAVSRQGSMVRGGGGFGRFARALESGNRDAARRQHADRVAPYDAARFHIEQRVLNIDAAIAHLDAYIAQQRTEIGTPSDKD